jgi:hemolysin activation/secretion protein
MLDSAMQKVRQTSFTSVFTTRLAGFCPLFLASPLLAESFVLPTCPIPIGDEKSLLDCGVKSNPAPSPSPNTPQPPIDDRLTTDNTSRTNNKTSMLPRIAATKEFDPKSVAQKDAPNPANPPPNPTQQTLPPDSNRPLPIPIPIPSDPILAPETSAEATVVPKIDKIIISGNTLLTIAEFDSPGERLRERLESSAKGKPGTKETICKLAQEIKTNYQDRGYILAKVYPILDRQTKSPVKNGTVNFRVMEGCLESIDIIGTQKLKPSYIYDRLVGGITFPFDAHKIDDFLALLKNDPKIAKIEILAIPPGKSFGSSTATIKVTEANSLAGFTGMDAYVAPLFGGMRSIGGLTYRNLTGNGDDLSGVYFRSISGEVEGGDFSYSIPLNSMNGQLQFRYASSSAKISFQPDNIPFTSISNTSELTYRQPLFRSLQSEFALSWGIAAQDDRSTFNGFPNANGVNDTDGNLRTRVVKFGQEYNSVDNGGNWALRSTFNLGLNDFGATINPKPIPDGRFFSWQGQVQRVQRLTPDNYAIAQFGVQLSPDSLVGNQQLTLGGDRSVRGYRQNIRSGDNGIVISLEDRTVISRNSSGQANLQLAANIDAAKVWNTNGDKIDRDFLASVGIGLIWEPLPRLTTRFEYGIPLVGIRDRGNSFQDSGFNFSIGYGF